MYGDITEGSGEEAEEEREKGEGMVVVEGVEIAGERDIERWMVGGGVLGLGLDVGRGGGAITWALDLM